MLSANIKPKRTAAALQFPCDSAAVLLKNVTVLFWQHFTDFLSHFIFLKAEYNCLQVTRWPRAADDTQWSPNRTTFPTSSVSVLSCHVMSQRRRRGATVGCVDE